LYDTIPSLRGGEGGGISPKGQANKKLNIKKEKSDIKEEHSKENVEITSSSKVLYDSICIQMRFQHYINTKNLCYELINNFPDSIESISSLSKLYLSVLRADTSSQAFSTLKTFYENLILNHPSDTALIMSSNYLVQKCKVRLGQYESAMNGFEQIINQNPYSYEGLLASWDYAATSLLDSLYGSGGGANNLELGMSDLEFEKHKDGELNLKKFQISNSKSQILDDDPKDKYDKKAFTKEDRKVIKENVFNSYNTSREKEVEIIKTLETKVAEGKATKDEKNELKTKKVLSEIVKAKKPVDIAEHIKIVNDNIHVLFGSASGSTNENDIKNIIPTEYYLSQNYPNPFNPVTKISFDLPNDVKVKLVVYDLLGREIKSIVNNVLTTGKYTFEFDGSNLASGVYFYRLAATGGAGDFTAVKRMVLVK